MDVLVVGGGLAGASAISTLRAQGFDGRITLLGEEPLPPYERPPLSKEYLRGEAAEPSFVRPAAWYEEQEVELRLGVRVLEVLPDDREVLLEGGERLRYDRLLVATGVRNRRLEVPGSDLPGLHDLRTVADADRLREAARGASSAVVVGAGLIGCEVAASLRLVGLEVTVVEPLPTPLHRVLGPELGRVVEAMHRDHGVRFALGEGVARFEGSGRAEAVVTEGGRRLEGDLIVVGVGTRADAPAGVADERGVVPVGPDLAAAAEGVYAAGDVAEHDHPILGRIRVEHYDNAIKMGETAARNLLGAGEVFDDPHWFWSDQYDSQLQVAGYATSWDQMVVRGSLEERSFAAFLLEGGVLRATVTLDRKLDARRSLPLIRAQARPDPALLADPEVDLRTLRGPGA